LNVVANAQPERSPEPYRARDAVHRTAPTLVPRDPGDQLEADIENMMQSLSRVRRRRAA
jgi:hypothetical protein